MRACQLTVQLLRVSPEEYCAFGILHPSSGNCPTAMLPGQMLTDVFSLWLPI